MGRRAAGRRALARDRRLPHLRRAFERQVVWAREFAHAGDAEAARRGRRPADAIRDELSGD
jgi:hypothetical protein